MFEKAAITEPAWDADAFGSCCVTTNMQLRDVQCRNVWDGYALDKSACESLPKPCQKSDCACGVMQCEDDAETCSPELMLAGVKCASIVDQRIEPIALGCIEDTLPRLSDTADAYDETCMTCSGDESCHGGLPYYRQYTSSATPKSCLEYCVKKGLDLAGLTRGGECRCGASPLNKAIETRPCLQLKLESLFSSNTTCPVAVYRYSGHYEDGGVPVDLQDLMASDTEYVDTVAHGQRLKSEPPDEEATNDWTVEPGIAAAAGNEGFDRKCWPSTCGPGGGPWTTRQSSPPAGVPNEWQEYVKLRYVFLPAINQARKNALSHGRNSA